MYGRQKRNCHICHHNRPIGCLKATSRGWECTDHEGCASRVAEDFNELAARNKAAIMKQTQQ